MRVAVIIVNYGTHALTTEAVDSVLARDHGGHEVEVHLVDNASPEDDAALFAARKTRPGWEKVTFWPEETNHGFGRGNNVVLEALAQSDTPPDYVFLLNPDARLENEAISILVDTLNANEKVGAVGAGILEPPDNQMVTACFRFPSLLGDIERIMGFGPISRLLKDHKAALPPDTPAGPVDWVAGCCVMFRFKALQEVQFFDPTYFLYFEEVDLMRQLAAKGWSTWYQPEALVVHAAGAATNVLSGAKDRRRRPVFVYQSSRYYYTKNHGWFYALFSALIVTLVTALTRVLNFVRRRPPARQPLYFYRDQWRYVLAPLLGLRRDPMQGAQDTTVIDAAEFSRIKPGTTNTNPADIGFWALVAEDFRTHDKQIGNQGFWALFWHRFGNWRMSLRWKIVRAPMSAIYRLMHKVTQWIGGIDLPFSVIVGRRVKLEHFGGMILIAERIGNDVIIRHNTTFGIRDLNHLKARPIIEDKVEIGVGSVILGDVIVGAKAVIGANSVVTRDVPAGATVAGAPARVLEPAEFKSQTRHG